MLNIDICLIKPKCLKFWTYVTCVCLFPSPPTRESRSQLPKAKVWICPNRDASMTWHDIKFIVGGVVATGPISKFKKTRQSNLFGRRYNFHQTKYDPSYYFYGLLKNKPKRCFSWQSKKEKDEGE